MPRVYIGWTIRDVQHPAWSPITRGAKSDVVQVVRRFVEANEDAGGVVMRESRQPREPEQGSPYDRWRPKEVGDDEQDFDVD